MSTAYPKPSHMASSVQILRGKGRPETFQRKFQLMAASVPMLSSLWFTLLRNQFLADTIQMTWRDLITIFTRILDVYLEGRYLMAGPRGCPEFMVDIWRLRNISLQFCLIVTSPHQIKRRYTWGVSVPWDTRRIWFIGSVK